MSVVRTTLEILTGDAGYEIEIDVDYSIYAGFAGSQEQPPEPASASINEVWVVGDDKTYTYPAPWLRDMLAEDGDILERCMADALDRAEYAAEQRADAKREAMMLGDDR